MCHISKICLRKKPRKCCIWSIALYGAETGTVRKLDRKYLESFETRRWRRTEISWADCVEKEEILSGVKCERNILHTVKIRKANWIGHILFRNCLLKYFIEGKIEGRIEVPGKTRKKRK